MSSQDSNTKSISQKLELLELANLIPIHIPDDVRDKIKFLCKSIAKVEWSGVLFYSLEGDMRDPEKMKITLRDILLMDKGNKTYTSFDWDEDVVNFQMDNPEAMDWTIGHIHSHNDMSVFFSSTDWSELNDNCPLHNFYLSVIVNNYLDLKAKIAFTGEAPNVKFKCKDKEGKDYMLPITGLEPSIKMLVYNCNITINHTDIIVPDSFVARLETLKVKQEAANKKIENPVVNNNKGYETYDLRNRVRDRAREPFPGYNGKEHEMSISEALQKDEEDDDPNTETLEMQFTTFLLRLGNVEDLEDDELEDALQDIEESRISMTQFKSSILDSYAPLYDKFFDTHPSYAGDDAFLDTLEEVINILEAQEASYPFLKGIIGVIDNLRIKFASSIKQNQ